MSDGYLHEITGRVIFRRAVSLGDLEVAHTCPHGVPPLISCSWVNLKQGLGRMGIDHN